MNYLDKFNDNMKNITVLSLQKKSSSISVSPEKWRT